jgi:hypothetical protein
MDNVTPDSWKSTLHATLEILRDLEKRGFGRPAFTMGGGTVLMFRFRHRMSNDIDLFITDLQWLTLMTPRLNDVSALLAQDYVEQANSLKLVTRDGDIDIIAAAPVIPHAQGEDLAFEGESIRLDSAAEILAKKLLYRASSLQPRDVFDIAAAIEFDAPSAAQALGATASKAPIVDRRLQELGRLPTAELERGIRVLDHGRRLLPGMLERVRRFIAGQADDAAGRT